MQCSATPDGENRKSPAAPGYFIAADAIHLPLNRNLSLLTSLSQCLRFANFTAMMRFLACCTVSLLLLPACKGKNEKPEVPAEQFFPVSAYLKGEISRMDKSLNSFYKIETSEGKTDTVPISSAEAQRLAADFYTLPDISSDRLKNDYVVTHTYDDALNAFVFLFTTAENHLVQREDVVLDPQPDAKGNYPILSIFAMVQEARGDTAIQKNLLWEAGKRYQVTTVSRAGETEQTKKLQVVWNGFDRQNP